MVKYRQIPKDFIVEEISDFEIKNSGKFRLYLIEKTGIESFYLMSYFSKKFNIPNRNIGIAGLKDKHAVTKQFLTIPFKYYIDNITEDNLKVTFLGFLDKEIKPGELSGNKFMITVRDIKKGEIDGIVTKAKAIEKIGVPNYFDSQRFGSVISGEFIAKFVIKGDFEGAVKIYLCEYAKSESKMVKDEKRYLLTNWNNLSKLNVKTPLLKSVVDEYKKTSNFLLSYKKIPVKLREMYISAYQSYIWNESVKSLFWMCLNKKSLYSVEYSCGTLLFYKNLDFNNKDLPDSFQLMGPHMKMNGVESEILSKILLKEGVKLSEFDIKDKTGTYFKENSRKIIIHPTEFSISEPQIDELNDKGKENRYRVVVSFILPKGSYATVVMKRLFNQ